MVYRRGPEKMSAFDFEYAHAREEGVKFLWHVQPTGINGAAKVESLDLVKLSAAEDDSLAPQSGSEFTLAIDLIILAIGQSTHTTFLADQKSDTAKIKLDRGRILIDRASGQTSNPKYFAGGDCTNGGREVVDAVADGKRAGIGIATWLEAQHV
jgi:glutamate synthase (NADPH/NADH) small chain